MPNAPRPNILWITTHDINPDLGCYSGIWPGAEYACTPNLDQLAADGMRFDTALATTPVCAPSRSAILTGMYPTAIGTMHMRSRAVPPPEVHCFPEYLRAAGYYCTNNAFSDFQFQVPVTVWDAHGPEAHWRNRPDPDQPFFAVFHGMLTHESQLYATPAQHLQNTQRLTEAQRHDPAQAPLPPYLPDTPGFRQAWAQYADTITAMDYQVGDLLAQLANDGLADSTMVVFWSDHGKGMPRAKRWPYDSGLRVPLIIRWPGMVVPGSHYAPPVMLMDLAATTLALAGCPLPDHLHARPLLSLDGQPTPARPYVFGHRDRMDEQEDTIRTVRDARFRYIRNYHPDRSGMQHHQYADQFATWKELRQLYFEEAVIHAGGDVPNLLSESQRQIMRVLRPPEELYDLQNDPHEISNLANDPNYATELERLRAALNTWQAEYGDLGLLPEAELVEQWRPGGLPHITAMPVVQQIDGQLVASCITTGASIGYTSDPPGQSEELPAFRRTTGDPNTGGRCWKLYHQPIIAQPGTQLWFRATRLGYAESTDILVVVE